MSPDAEEERPLPKFRAVLPPELEGIDWDEEERNAVPLDWDEFEALLEAEWAKTE
jgi:hypothetical protein